MYWMISAHHDDGNIVVEAQHVFDHVRQQLWSIRPRIETLSQPTKQIKVR